MKHKYSSVCFIVKLFNKTHKVSYRLHYRYRTYKYKQPHVKAYFILTTPNRSQKSSGKQSEDLKARDLDAIWHPCTQMKDHEDLPMTPIKKAKGVWLEDFDGKRYIDGISSWWVNLFGHANDTISNSIKQQLDTMEHVPVSYTHLTLPTTPYV